MNVSNVAAKNNTLVLMCVILLMKAKIQRPATSAPAHIEIHVATSLCNRKKVIFYDDFIKII